MAHWTFELEAAWYDVQSNRKDWRPPDNSRPVVPEALRDAAANTRTVRVVNLRSDIARLILNIAAGQTGTAGGADLSSDFETAGQILFSAPLPGGGTAEWTFRVVDADAADAADTYIWNLSGDAATAYDEFRDALSDTAGAQACTVTVWDGQGTNPFATAPTLTVAAPTVDDATPTNGDTVTFTAGAVGGTATGAISYRWQSLSGSAWSDIAGETGSTLDRTRATAGTVTVRVVVTRGGVSATSAQASATWSADTTAPIAIPSDPAFDLAVQRAPVDVDSFFIWTPLRNLAVDLPGDWFADGVARRLDYFTLYDNGEVELGVVGASFLESVRANLVLYVAHGETVARANPLGGTDTANSYSWTPGNAADWEGLYTAIRGASDRSIRIVIAVGLPPVDAAVAFGAGVPGLAAAALPVLAPVDAEIAFFAGRREPTLWGGFEWGDADWYSTLTSAPAVSVVAKGGFEDVSAAFETDEPRLAVAAEEIAPVDAGPAFRSGLPAVRALAQGIRRGEVALEAGAPLVAAGAVREHADAAAALEAGTPALGAAADTVGPVASAASFAAGAPAVAAGAVETGPLDASTALAAGPPAFRVAAQAVHDGEIALEAGAPEISARAVAHWIDVAVSFAAGIPSVPAGPVGDAPVSIVFRSNFRNRQRRRWKPRIGVRPDTIGPVTAAMAFRAGTPGLAVSADRDRTNAAAALAAGPPAFRVAAQAVHDGEIALEAGAPEISARAVAHWIDAEIGFRGGSPGVAAGPEQDRIDAAIAFEAGVPSLAAAAVAIQNVEIAVRAGDPSFAARSFVHWLDAAAALAAAAPAVSVRAEQDRADAAVSLAAAAPAARVTVQAVADGETALAAGAPGVSVRAEQDRTDAGVAYGAGIPAASARPVGETPAEIAFRSDRRRRPRIEISAEELGPKDVAAALAAGTPSVSVAADRDRTDAGAVLRAGSPEARIAAQAIAAGEIAFEAGLPGVRAGAAASWIDVSIAFNADTPMLAVRAEQDRADAAVAFAANAPALSVAAQGVAGGEIALHAGLPVIRVRAVARWVNAAAAFSAGTPAAAASGGQDRADAAVSYRASAPAVAVRTQGLGAGEIPFHAGPPAFRVRAAAHWIDAGAAFSAGRPGVAADAGQDRVDAAVSFEAGGPAYGVAGREAGSAEANAAVRAGRPGASVAAEQDPPDIEIALGAGAPAIAADARGILDVALEIAAGAPAFAVAGLRDREDAAIAFSAASPAVAVHAEAAAPSFFSNLYVGDRLAIDFYYQDGDTLRHILEFYDHDRVLLFRAGRAP